jgi:hypothetical protein
MCPCSGVHKILMCMIGATARTVRKKAIIPALRKRPSSGILAHRGWSQRRSSWSSARPGWRADSQVYPTPRRVQDGPRNRTFELEVETDGPGSHIGHSEGTLLTEHHGVTSWHGPAKLGGRRSVFAPTIGLAGLLRSPGRGATRCRWYPGLGDRQALECHARLRVGAASALVVRCSAAAGRHGR